MTDIYTALAAVMADISHVAKRDINQHQRFNFRGIDAVVNAVGPVFRKHGVIAVPTDTQATFENVTTSGGKPATACRVLATYTFYAPDGTSIDARVAAEAWDNGDKAAPKAMSVAYRTALLQALCLPTDEPDPDTHTYVQEATPTARDIVLKHHRGDFQAAIAAADAAGFTLPADLDRYAAHITGETS